MINQLIFRIFSHSCSTYDITRVCHLKGRNGALTGSVFLNKQGISRINTGFEIFEKIYLPIRTYMKIFVPVFIAFSSALR